MTENKPFPSFWLRFRSNIPGRSSLTCPSAVAKYWFEKYEAVPALMTPDVLEYTIPFGTSVPSWQALDLALEQYAYCNDIVDQGVETVGRLADGLMKSHNWYFWWD